MNAAADVMQSEDGPIACVAVIGAGEQGRAFALRCAQAGFRTVLEDVMPAKLRQAEAALTELKESTVANMASRLSFALTVEEAVRDADLAIDFVPDELESKLEIFSLLDRMAPPKTILCTPTRALSIGDLGMCTYRADRCIALHADGQELGGSALRLVRGGTTTEAVVERTKSWLEQMRFTVEVEKDQHADAPVCIAPIGTGAGAEAGREESA